MESSCVKTKFESGKGLEETKDCSSLSGKGFLLGFNGPLGYYSH